MRSILLVSLVSLVAAFTGSETSSLVENSDLSTRISDLCFKQVKLRLLYPAQSFVLFSETPESRFQYGVNVLNTASCNPTCLQTLGESMHLTHTKTIHMSVPTYLENTDMKKEFLTELDGFLNSVFTAPSAHVSRLIVDLNVLSTADLNSLSGIGAIKKYQKLKEITFLGGNSSKTVQDALEIFGQSYPVKIILRTNVPSFTLKLLDTRNFYRQAASLDIGRSNIELRHFLGRLYPGLARLELGVESYQRFYKTNKIGPAFPSMAFRGIKRANLTPFASMLNEMTPLRRLELDFNPERESIEEISEKLIGQVQDWQTVFKPDESLALVQTNNDIAKVRKLLSFPKDRLTALSLKLYNEYKVDEWNDILAEVLSYSPQVTRFGLGLLSSANWTFSFLDKMEDASQLTSLELELVHFPPETEKSLLRALIKLTNLETIDIYMPRPETPETVLRVWKLLISLVNIKPTLRNLRFRILTLDNSQTKKPLSFELETIQQLCDVLEPISRKVFLNGMEAKTVIKYLKKSSDLTRQIMFNEEDAKEWERVDDYENEIEESNERPVGYLSGVKSSIKSMVGKGWLW